MPETDCKSMAGAGLIACPVKQVGGAEFPMCMEPGLLYVAFWDATAQPALARFFRSLYSAFATFIRRSSSLTGIQDVKTFMAFSKSESSKISLVASMRAAEVAWRTSISPLNFE